MKTYAPVKEKAATPGPTDRRAGPAAPVAVQRKAECACGGGCQRCREAGRSSHAIAVSRPGDSHEREADHVAASVMNSISQRGAHTIAPHTPAASPLRLSLSPLSGSTGSTRGASGQAASAVHDVVRSPGRPIDASTRALMEPRFGRDFSHVHIHADAAAAQSAQAIRAKAYTFGSHIAFAPGHYAPESSEGQRLLAHELAHVVQQEAAGSAPHTIQRAEVDDRSCAGLTDIESDVDTKINAEIAAARSAAGGSSMPASAIPGFLDDVMTRLGKGIVSPMEDFIEALPATKRKLPPNSLKSTKYEDVSAVNRFYMAQTMGMAHVVGSAAKIHGICVGADKLGHFFQEGYIYFQIATDPALGGTTAAAASAGRALEIGREGLAATGVYSNADQAANTAGMKFYNDLKAWPGMTFKIASYLTSSWNEQANPSFYESSVGGVVWNNLLKGKWKGPFTKSAVPSSLTDTNVTLTPTSSGVTGTYEYPAAAPTNHGSISGTVTQNITSVSGTFPGKSPSSATPVSGITINFTWTEGTVSGKGVWTSTDEQTLTGTWGSSASATSGGTWSLKKV